LLDVVGGDRSIGLALAHSSMSMTAIGTSRSVIETKSTLCPSDEKRRIYFEKRRTYMGTSMLRHRPFLLHVWHK
jgi:hypothetical protein